MESVGFEESAGGGSRSSTVAWPHVSYMAAATSAVSGSRSTYTTILMCPRRSRCALGWRKTIALDGGIHFR